MLNIIIKTFIDLKVKKMQYLAEANICNYVLMCLVISASIALLWLFPFL